MNSTTPQALVFNRKDCIFFSFVPLSVPLYGQDTQRTINVKYISGEITVDGVMDEAVWERADVAQNFWQFFPTESLRRIQALHARLSA